MSHGILEVLACLNPQLINSYFPRYTIPATDIAHCLGTIHGSPGIALLGRFKWAKQYEWEPDLAICLANRWFEEHRDYRTPKAYIGKDLLRNLAYEAIKEFDEEVPCPKCDTKGTYKEGDLVKDCLFCNGTGRLSSESRITAYDGVRRTIYSDQLSILASWENRLTTALQINFPLIYFAIEKEAK